MPIKHVDDKDMIACVSEEARSYSVNIVECEVKVSSYICKYNLSMKYDDFLKS